MVVVLMVVMMFVIVMVVVAMVMIAFVGGMRSRRLSEAWGHGPPGCLCFLPLSANLYWCQRRLASRHRSA
jgi:hypothetical protein